MFRPRIAVPIGLVLALSLTGSPAAAQTVVGTVVDGGTNVRLPAAVISLVRDGQVAASAESDSAGTFRVRVLRPGDYTLRVESLGFETHELAVELGAVEVVTVRVVLGVRPVELAAISVTARMRRGAGTALEAFHERQYWMGERLGLGRFFDQEQIEAINPMAVTDLLKTMPGVRLIPANVNGTYAIRLGRNDCAPKIYLDGVWFNRWEAREAGGFTSASLRRGTPDDPADAGADRNADIDLMISPSMLGGVEVYPRGSELPAEFADGEMRAFRCGVIALWSRRGG